jgi:hypothetical protein
MGLLSKALNGLSVLAGVPERSRDTALQQEQAELRNNPYDSVTVGVAMPGANSMERGYAYGVDYRNIAQEHTYAGEAEDMGALSVDVSTNILGIGDDYFTSDGRAYMFDVHPDDITAMDNMRGVVNDARINKPENVGMYPYDRIELEFNASQDYAQGNPLQPEIDEVE